MDHQYAETLAALGLNSTQVKVYLTLLSLGQSRAKTIWKNAKVARQDVYRILNELELKSLVEKIIWTPTEFRALPMQDALSVLLKEREQEYDLLRKKTNNLLEKTIAKQKENATAKEFEFKILSTKDAYLRKLKDSINSTQKSIDILDSFDQLRYRGTSDSDLIPSLVKKNVRIRLIINKPKDGQCLPKAYSLSQRRNKNNTLEIRTVPKEPLATISIEDGKICILSVTPIVQKREETLRLCSDNPCLVAVLQDYFERIWNEAVEDKKLYFVKKRNHASLVAKKNGKTKIATSHNSSKLPLCDFDQVQSGRSG